MSPLKIDDCGPLSSASFKTRGAVIEMMSSVIDNLMSGISRSPETEISLFFVTKAGQARDVVKVIFLGRNLCDSFRKEKFLAKISFPAISKDAILRVEGMALTLPSIVNFLFSAVV